MPRKVKVELDLDASRYMREARGVAVTTKAVDEEMQSLGRATDAAGRDMEQLAAHAGKAKGQVDGLGDQVSGTSRAMDGLAGTAKLAGHEVDGFGDQAAQAAAALALLDARIKATRLSAQNLRVEFARTGDAATGKQLGSERTLLGQLTRLRSELVTLGADGQKLGSMIGYQVTSGIGGALDLGGPELKAILISILVGAALAASPMIGAVVGGAVAGGVGTLGVAAGIFAASHDPRVQSGLSALGERVKKEFFDAGEAFVGPVLNSLGVLNHALDEIKFGDVLKKAAPYVEIIVTGLADLLRNTMPGLDRTLGRLGPFAQVAADEFGDLGDTFAGFLDDVTRSRGAIEGLRTGFMLIEAAVLGLGKGIYYLSEAYDWMLTRGEAAAVALAAVAEQIPGAQGFADVGRMWAKVLGDLRDVPGAVGPAAKATGAFGDAAWYAAMKVGDLSAAWDVLHGKVASADETLLAAKKGLQDVADTFAHGGKQVQGSTVAILENRVALEQQAQKAAVAAEAYYKLTGDAAGAQKIMDDQRIATEKATGATGNNAKAVHDLAVELFKLPPFVEVKVTVAQTVFTKYVTTGNAPQINAKLNMEDRLLGGRAEGGPVGPGLWKVGERGPEYLEMGPGQNGYVHPKAPWQSANAGGAWQAASSGGGAPSTVRHIVDFQVNGQTMRSLLITDALNRNQSPTVVKVAYP